MYPISSTTILINKSTKITTHNIILRFKKRCARKQRAESQPLPPRLAEWTGAELTHYDEQGILYIYLL
jgi:hypothetical protein